MVPIPPVPPLTTEQQVAQILLAQETAERKQDSSSLRFQLYAALGISFVFLLLTWHKFGFSWAISNVLLSDFYILFLITGNPWHWLFHRQDPHFKVTASSRIITWVLLIGSLVLGLIISPGSLSGGNLQNLAGTSTNLQQAQQLQQELSN